MTEIADRARAALAASAQQTAEDPRLIEGLAHLEAGRLEEASNTLAVLDDPGLVLGTMFLERRAVLLGHESIEILAEPLLEKVPAGSLDYGWIARRFESAWSAETAGHLAATRVAKRGEHGGFADVALLQGVESLVERGEIDAAREQLAEFGWYDKARSSRAYALVGVAADDAKLMTEAVKVARKSPMIQDGGEEAEALGGVLRVFAEGDIDADHPAVDACVSALLKLGKKRARKDVRSWGLGIAATAAARRGGAWAAHARTLLASIWTDALKAPAWLALAAQQPEDAAELLESVALEDDIADLFPEHLDDLIAFLQSNRGALDHAKLLRKHGRPTDALIDQAIQENGRYWQGIEKIWGQVLLADEARAEALFEEFDEHDNPEVALVNAAYALESEGDLERAAEYFIRALDAGFYPLYGSSAGLLLKVPQLLEPAVQAAMAVRDRSDRMESLSLLAQLHIELGEWDAAARLIAIAIAGPAGEEDPEWTPWSLKGDRGSWRPERQIRVPATTGERDATALNEVKALERSEQLDAYWKLAFDLHPDALHDLRKLMAKAPGGRGDAAQIKRAKLVEVSLIVGDIDAALGEAESMSDCRVSGWGPAYTAETIAAWLAGRPEEANAERASRVLGIMRAAIPQDIPHTLASVVRHLAPALNEAEQRPFLDAVREFRGKFRRAQDAVAVDAVVAMGEARCGLTTARESMSRAIGAIAPSLFTGPIFYIRLLRSADMLDPELTVPVLTMPATGRVYEQCMNLERSTRIFWDAGLQTPVARLLGEGHFGSEVTDQTRRSLIVMAPDYAPNPVDAVWSVWLDEPPNEDQAREQINALRRALEAEGRDEEARGLASL